MSGTTVTREQLAQWIAELSRNASPVDGEGGETITEIAARTGLANARVTGMVKALLATGQARRFTARRESITGRVVPIVVFKIEEKPDGRKKPRKQPAHP